MNNHVDELGDGSISDSLSELGLSESRNAVISAIQSSKSSNDHSLDTLVLLILLDGGIAKLGSSSGNKDLVSGHVTGSGVVLTVLNREKGNQKHNISRTEILQEW